MRRLTATVLLAVLAGAFAGPALAADGDCRLIRGATTTTPDDDVSVCRQDTWVHRATQPVGNVGEAAGYPTWDTTKPTASYQAGAGGGALGSSITDIVLNGDPHHGAHWEGTFTGPVDTLAVDLYLIMLNGAAFSGHGLTTVLEIDGATIVSTDEIDATTSAVSDGLAVARFVFEDVYAAMQAMQLDLAPAATHEVSLTVSPYYFGDDGAYVWDAAEAPSGLIFNLEKLTGYTRIDTA